MNPFALSGILAGATSFSMAVFMFFKGKRDYHFLWGIFCISVMFWGFGGYKIATVMTPEEGILWWRVAYIGVIWIPLLFTHFVYKFLQINNRPLIVFLYFFGAFFSLINLGTDIFINSVRWSFDQFYYAYPATPLFMVYTAVFFIFVFFSHWKLWKGYLKASGYQKLQIKYFFIAMLVSFAGGSLSYLPHYDVNIYPYGNLTVFLYPLIIGYAIFKYRLMDINVVVRRSTVFAVLVAIITSIYSVFLFLSTEYLQRYASSLNPVRFTGLITGVLVALGFEPLKKALQKYTDRIFFKDEYDAQEYLNFVGNVLSTGLDFHRIVTTLSQSFVRVFKIGGSAVIVLDKNSGYYKVESNIALPKISSVTFHLEHALPRYFQKHRAPLVFEEFQRDFFEGKPTKEEKHLYTQLAGLPVGVYVPLFHRDELTGMFLLAPKRSGDLFSRKDLQTLEIVANQASITFVNAKLYQETKQFNIILKDEINKAVEDLQGANRQLNRANIKLKQLDREKSEFISIASHQLRTPLTIIKGYISMLLEGDFGKVQDGNLDPLKKVFTSNERLINLVEDLLNVSRIEDQRLQYTFVKTDLGAMVKSVVEELSPNAVKKHLAMSCEVSDELPHAMIDGEKIRQVIFNLVDNAIKYTDVGRVSVRVFVDGNDLVIAVQDTGIGLTEEDRALLFEKFSRVKEATERHIQGTGLGLFVAKKVVEAHKGKVWVTSPGREQGSTFYVRLSLTATEKELAVRTRVKAPVRHFGHEEVEKIDSHPEK